MAWGRRDRRPMAKVIQLRHVPDAVHRRRKSQAETAGLSLSDYLVREVGKLAALPSPEEMRERLQRRRPYRGRRSPTDVLRTERDRR